MIIGHLAVVGIAKLTFFEIENLAVLAVASFGPDILDKPANILLGMPGRGMSHSLVVFYDQLFLNNHPYRPHRYHPYKTIHPG